MITNGPIYTYKKKKEKYTAPLKKCIEGTVKDLLANPTDPRRPGMLLGRVQAGKTFAYCGIMSLAIDNGFDSIIILTKGTKFLLSQTFKRIKAEFDFMIEEDTLDVMDIMRVEKLSGYQLKKKLVFCVKKEDDNMNRLLNVYDSHESLKNGRTLIIDDEADFCGISFRRNRGEVRVGTIMRQISDFRLLLREADYLLVTATPFSLYLQPEQYDESIAGRLAPTRPVFTHLVPKHDRYIGGDHFFNLSTEASDTIYHDIQEEVPFDELRNLRNPNSIRLNAKKPIQGVEVLQDAILNFVVGGSIRRLQQKYAKQKQQKYSFILHTETTKVRHEWQESVIECCIKNFSILANNNPKSFKDLIGSYYQYFEYSIGKLQVVKMPSVNQVLKEVMIAFNEGYLEIVKVNSDSDTESMMDEETGQLKLSSPFMIFVGGSILDRGISIENLVAFYYGRNPNRFQMDSVLQHLRCFGPRPINDMAITRMYSSERIYSVLNSMHQIENAMWMSIERNGPNCPINFIQQQLASVVPCSPNKVLFSDVITINPGKRFLPVGFETKKAANQERITLRVDHIVHRIYDLGNQPQTELIKIKEADAVKIIESIWDSFTHHETEMISLSELKSILAQLIRSTDKDEINLIVRVNRKIKRMTADGRFVSSPDTAVGPQSERRIARENGDTTPSLILLRQSGLKENGWNDSAFYWPIVIAQNNMETSLFAKK